MKKLSKKQMSELQGGGQTYQDYCETAQMIIENNDVPYDAILVVMSICG